MNDVIKFKGHLFTVFKEPFNGRDNSLSYYQCKNCNLVVFKVGLVGDEKYVVSVYNNGGLEVLTCNDEIVRTIIQ